MACNSCPGLVPHTAEPTCLQCHCLECLTLIAGWCALGCCFGLASGAHSRLAGHVCRCAQALSCHAAQPGLARRQRCHSAASYAGAHPGSGLCLWIGAQLARSTAQVPLECSRVHPGCSHVSLLVLRLCSLHVGFTAVQASSLHRTCAEVTKLLCRKL